MTDYTITTDFGAKDSLPSGDSNKVVKGSEFTTEFTNIQTAINTKADSAGDTFTGVVNFNASAVFNNDVIVDGDTLFVDVSTDRVGIGTNSPQAQLHVKNNDAGFEVDVDGQISDGVRLLAYDRNTSTNRNMQYSASQHLFTIGSSEKMRINTSGHVGIGTVSPDQKAHLSGAGTQYLRVENTTNSVVTDFGTSSTGSTIINRSAHPIEFFTDSTKRMTIDATGNVGIGTDSPTRQLVIKNSANAELELYSGAANSGFIYFRDSGDSNIGALGYDHTNNFMNFRVNDAERMRIDSSGNVGIGTSSPTHNLHIEDSSTTQIKVKNTTNNTEVRLGSSATGGDGFVGTASEDSLSIITNNATRMTVDSDGKVGIGTTSPDSALEVEGSVNGRHQIHIQNTFDDDDEVAPNPSARLYLSAASNNGYLEAHGAPEDSAGLHKIDLGSTAVNSFLTFSPANTERMRIDATGNVGIGTSSPANTLTVGNLTASANDQDATVGIKCNANHRGIILQENSGAEQWSIGVGEAGALKFYDSDSATPAVTFADETGNVGIGTDNPQRELEVTGTGNVYARITAPTDNDSAALELKNTQETWQIRNTDTNDDALEFIDDTATRLTIKKDGNVGIGTSSPSYPLDVDGLIASRDAYLITANSSGTPSAGAFMFRPASNTLALGTNSTERMRIDASGNLLVGTTDTSLYNNTSGEGFSVVNNELGIAKSGTCAYFNRMGSDGENVKFFKDGSTVGSIGVSGSRPYLSNGVNDGIKIADDYVAPCNQTGADKDASLDLGSSSVRFKDIYRSGSTYSTSDRNKKQDIRDLTDAEARVATVAKGSLKAFRYIDSVEAEGDEANIHFGIIAQDLKAAFEAEGLNANDYQVFKTSTYTDDDGVEQTTYSVCYENLLAFIIAAI